MESKVVSAIGVSVNTLHGEAVNARLEKAMTDEILACNAEGISTDEKNSAIIHARMNAAREREMDLITTEAAAHPPA